MLTELEILRAEEVVHLHQIVKKPEAPEMLQQLEKQQGELIKAHLQQQKVLEVRPRGVPLQEVVVQEVIVQVEVAEQEVVGQLEEVDLVVL